MPIFTYRAENPAGDIEDSRVKAVSIGAAEEVLTERGYKIITLNEEGKRNLLEISWHLFRYVSLRNLVIFTRQFSILIGANVSVINALKILVKQTNNENLKIIISEIYDDVEGGMSLAGALEKHDEVFDKFYVNIVRAGEKSGKLDEVLEYLAGQGEKDYELMRKMRNMMIYPAFVLLSLIIVGIVTIIYIVPRLIDIFKEMSGELPWPTRMLILFSSGINSYWWLIIILLILVVVAGYFFINTNNGRWIFDNFKLKVPILGSFLQKLYVTRFTRSLYTLLIGGVEIVGSLHIIAEVTGNEVFKKLIDQVASDVEVGNSLSDSLGKSELIPLMVSQMINVGEKSGQLDQVLEKITDFYSREVEAGAAAVVAAIEPMIIIFLGLAVAGMVSAVILPLYNMAGQF